MSEQQASPMEPGDGERLQMGYRERTLWVSLLAVALLDTLYFGLVLYRWWIGEPLSAGELGVLLVVIVGLLVLIQRLFASANRSQREPMDERDHLIAAQATSLGYGVFAGLVMVALLLHLANGAGEPGPLFGLAVFDLPLIEVHLILVCLVSAELVRHTSALARYRRGY